MDQYKTKKIGLKIVVFGAGFLGTRISNELDAMLVSEKEVDARRVDQVGYFLDKEKPDAIINAVGKIKGRGHIGIDWCKFNPEESIQGNVISPAVLSTEASKRGIHFTHLGSGCIYDGDKDGLGWTEKDEPTTYNRQFYINTKIDAERVLQNLNGLLMRIRMPIDEFPHKRNIIDKLLSYDKIHDGQNSVIVVLDMIKAMDLLISKRKEGIYNFVNPGTISMAEVMQLYSEIVEPHKFKIINSEELDKITEEKRTTCYLNTDKLQKDLKEFGWEMPEAKESVKNCLIRYKINREKNYSN